MGNNKKILKNNLHVILSELKKVGNNVRYFYFFKE